MPLRGHAGGAPNQGEAVTTAVERIAGEAVTVSPSGHGGVGVTVSFLFGFPACIQFLYHLSIQLFFVIVETSSMF